MLYLCIHVFVEKILNGSHFFQALQPVYSIVKTESCELRHWKKLIIIMSCEFQLLSYLWQ